MTVDYSPALTDCQHRRPPAAGEQIPSSFQRGVKPLNLDEESVPIAIACETFCATTGSLSETQGVVGTLFQYLMVKTYSGDEIKGGMQEPECIMFSVESTRNDSQSQRATRGNSMLPISLFSPMHQPFLSPLASATRIYFFILRFYSTETFMIMRIQRQQLPVRYCCCTTLPNNAAKLQLLSLYGVDGTMTIDATTRRGREPCCRTRGFNAKAWSGWWPASIGARNRICRFVRSRALAGGEG